MLQVSINRQNIYVAFMGEKHCTKTIQYCVSQLAIGFLKSYKPY
jgi:hypothetical protein